MNKSALNFAVGVLVGIVGIVVWEMIRESEQSVVVDNSAMERDLTTIVELLNEISYKLERQNEYIAFLPGGRQEPSETMAQESIDSVRDIERVPVESKIENSPEPKVNAVDWTKYVDDDLARALIEHGLTPFDIGVSYHLLTAKEKLTELNSRYMPERGAFNKKWPKRPKTDDVGYSDWLEEYRSIENRQHNERKEVVSDFRNSLWRLIKR